jgi:hypothetical protein
VSDPILHDVYRLKSHPFGDAYKGPLDPRVDPATVANYVDVYRWEKSPLLQRISGNQLLEVFPDDKTIDAAGSMMVLIAGDNQTGKESLRNLILHKLQRDGAAANAEPIVTELELQEGDRAESIRQIATMFAYTYEGAGLAAPKRPDLEQILDKATGRRAATDKAYYADVFQLWRQLIKRHCTRPLVLSVGGVYLYNTLQVIYNSTRHLFKFIVVVTDSPSDAETCRKLLADEKRTVVLIESGKLARGEVESYVRQRLNAERRADAGFAADSLFPFSVSALDALFARGPTLAEKETVRWHLDFVNSTLRRAIDDHVATLATQMAGRSSNALAVLAPEDLLIGAEAIKDARRAIHKTSRTSESPGG